MPVVISMLRGVNVGGHNKIRMEELRRLYESLGLLAPQTYIQSGNVIFRTEKRDLLSLTKRIEDGIERNFGFRPAVIVRTASQLRDAIAGNPFATRPDLDPRKLLVSFLAGDPDAEARRKVLAMKVEPEELRMAGCELYIYFHNGMARTKLSMPLIERTLTFPGTGRNWNTVRKLLEIAEELESSR